MPSRSLGIQTFAILKFLSVEWELYFDSVVQFPPVNALSPHESIRNSAIYTQDPLFPLPSL